MSRAYKPSVDLEEAQIADRLRDERPWPTPLELDRAKQRALASRPQRMRSLRPRLALVCVVALGVLFSGTGVTLALSGNISAAQVVYQPQVAPQVLGQNGSGQPNQPNQTLPSTETQPTVQGARQVAASATQTLPFTGLAAIPILVIGLGMIVAGAILARRTREHHA